MINAELSEKNGFSVYDINSVEFACYGRVLRDIDYSTAIEYLQKNTAVPEKGNVYVADEERLFNDLSKIHTTNKIFGELPCQAGYCNGNNSELTCFEWHSCSEVCVAATPLVLLLASITNISEGVLNTKVVKAFCLSEGEAVELYSTTLHFAPCRVQDSGFKSLIYLLKGTNTPLEAPHEHKGFLFMKNKWLISKPDTAQAVKGAVVAITGENIQVQY